MPLANNIFSSLFPYRATPTRPTGRPTTPAWNPDAPIFTPLGGDYAGLLSDDPQGEPTGRPTTPAWNPDAPIFTPLGGNYAGLLSDDLQGKPTVTPNALGALGGNYAGLLSDSDGASQGGELTITPNAPLGRLTMAPVFQYPYPNPTNEQEHARNALAEAMFNYKHPKNKDKGVKGFLKELVQNFGAGMARTPRGASVKQALLLGGIGAGVGAADRTTNERRQIERELPGLIARAKIADDAAYRDVQIENWREDNRRQNEQAKALADWRDREIIRKDNERISRERTARMNAVAGMFKSIPAIDFTDPKFAALKEALGDVNLPITDKDAKKKVDLKQDQRTGEWTVILTDPVTGKQEVRDVIKDGKQFATTPTVVVQGEYGMLKQNDQQTFIANLEAGKIQARLAFQQLEQAQGRLKALEIEKAKFIAAFLKETKTLPSEEEINKYLNTVAGQ